MKTKLDLRLSAHAVALKSLDVNTAHGLSNVCLVAFNEEKIEPLHYDAWTADFYSVRNQYLALREQPLPVPVKA